AIRIKSGETYPVVSVLAYDVANDLALLDVGRSMGTPVRLGDPATTNAVRRARLRSRNASQTNAPRAGTGTRRRCFGAAAQVRRARFGAGLRERQIGEPVVLGV